MKELLLVLNSLNSASRFGFVRACSKLDSSIMFLFDLKSSLIVLKSSLSTISMLMFKPSIFPNNVSISFFIASKSKSITSKSVLPILSWNMAMLLTSFSKSSPSFNSFKFGRSIFELDINGSIFRLFNLSTPINS